MKWFLPFLLLWCSPALSAGDIVNPGANSIGVGIYNPTSSGPNVDLNLATATYVGCTPATCLAIVRASSKTDLLPTSTSGLQFNTFGSNVLATTSGFGLRSEEARTNQLLNSCSGTTYPTQCAGNTGPATQTTGTLTAALSTLWVNGSGSAALTNGTATGCTGTASQGTPVNFTPTAGTCVVTVTGSLNAFQLEAGGNGTSLIITTGSALARSADSISLAGLALTDAQSSSFFAVIYTNLITGVSNSGLLEGTLDDIIRESSATSIRSTFGVTQLNGTIGSGSYTTGLVKSAIGVSPGARSLVANNGTLVSDTTSISVNTSFFIGSAGSGSIVCDCWIPRIQFGTPQPSNATLSGFTQ
jgi:hypothetical protein